MPRYESGTDKASRFWEITVLDNVLHTRYGRVGSDGRASEPRIFGTAEQARAEADRRIAAKVRKGFACVDDDVSGYACNPELLAAIARSPEDDEGYLVYGDWLQSQGDLRGELIAIEDRLRRSGDEPLQARVAALEKQLTPARLAQMLRKKQSPKKAASGYCAVEWRHGFIDRARIGRSSDRPPYTVRELVVGLLSHPSAVLVRSLVIGALGPVDEYDYSAVVAEIAALAPVSLRELVIADFAPEHSELAASSLGDVSVLWPTLPRLERLHLRGGRMDLGEVGRMSLPALCELVITKPEFSARMLDVLAEGWFPALVRLDLCAGGTAFPDAARLGQAPGMAGLRHLSIRDTDHTFAVLDGLAGSEMLRRLEVLDLSGGSMTDRDAERLLGRRHFLSHLRELNLERNYLSGDAVAGLAGICSQVRVGGQRPLARGQLSVTEQQLLDFAPDTRSVAAARKLVKTGIWPSLGREGTLIWGRCQGGELYDVYVDVEAMESGCTCPSMKYPCKHAIGLLLLAQSATIPEEAPPPGFVEGCEVR